MDKMIDPADGMLKNDEIKFVTTSGVLSSYLTYLIEQSHHLQHSRRDSTADVAEHNSLLQARNLARTRGRLADQRRQ
jgi:hypothetical protein